MCVQLKKKFFLHACLRQLNVNCIKSVVQIIDKWPEISVIMKNLEIQISKNKLAPLLMESHPGIRRIILITSATTNQPTQMVRIFVQYLTTAN